MKPRLSLIWATLWSLGSALVDRFRPLDRAGLVTEDDADAFVDAIRALPAAELDPVVVEPVPVVFLCNPVVLEPPLIADVLEQEWPAMYARRLRALTWATAEFEVQWKGLTSMLELDWMCEHCAVDAHADCPSCSCSCSLVVTG